MDTEDSAYLLHQRNLSDSRIIVELFTQHHGRIAAIWRRGKGRAKYVSVQSFNLFECVFYGATELKKLKYLERGSQAQGKQLLGESLYCGFYLNEILMRGLAKEEPYPDIFQLYSLTLAELAATQQKQQLKSVLRKFELRALNFLGYGIDFSIDVDGKAIESSPDCHYRFVAGEGFLPTSCIGELSVYSGEVLREIGRENWRDAAIANAAKQICRAALRQVIGDKPLKSRELYRAPPVST